MGSQCSKAEDWKRMKGRPGHRLRGLQRQMIVEFLYLSILQGELSLSVMSEMHSFKAVN